MHDNNAHADGGYIDRAGDSALALQAHLPQGSFEMLQVGLADSFEAVLLNQFYNALKAGSDIERRASSAALVSSSRNPTAHRIVKLYLFCDVLQTGERRGSRGS